MNNHGLLIWLVIKRQKFPNYFTWEQKKQFYKGARYYLWDEPYLFIVSADRLIRRCVAGKEAEKIMWQCHNSSYGGHHSEERRIAKILQCDFWWPTIFKDCKEYVQKFPKGKKTCNISKRDEMSQNGIVEVKPFDCWEIDFMGHFPPSKSLAYILVCVDYVTK